jgi:hypothetical protein
MRGSVPSPKNWTAMTDLRRRGDDRLARRLSRAALGRGERVRRVSRSGRRQADGRGRAHRLVAIGRAETYLAIVIIGREIAISALARMDGAARADKSIAVAFIGKVKTVAQMTAIIALLLGRT